MIDLTISKCFVLFFKFATGFLPNKLEKKTVLVSTLFPPDAKFLTGDQNQKY